MSASGLPLTAIRSAYFPFSIDPIRSCQPIRFRHWSWCLLESLFAGGHNPRAAFTSHSNSWDLVAVADWWKPSVPPPTMIFDAPFVAAAMYTAFLKDRDDSIFAGPCSWHPSRPCKALCNGRKLDRKKAPSRPSCRSLVLMQAKYPCSMESQPATIAFFSAPRPPKHVAGGLSCPGGGSHQSGPWRTGIG